jgi:hypothetical protein
MHRAELIAMLEALREAPAPASIDAVRVALAATDLGAALPLEDLFVDDVAGDVDAVVSMLEDRPGSLLADALAAELYGGDDLVDGVMAALFEPPPRDALAETLTPAVSSEAGRAPELGTEHDAAAVEVAPAVATEAGPAPELAAAHDADALPVSGAVSAEAGRAPELAEGLDEASVQVAEAVHAESGPAPELARAHDPAALPLAVALSAESGRAPELARAHDPGAVAVADAVRAAAGRTPELGEVVAPLGLPIAPAVAESAGRAPEVAARFDAGALPVAEAVAVSAGKAEVADAVVAWLGLPSVDVAGALVAEAGTIDVRDAVLAAIGAEAAAAPSAPAPSPVEDAPEGAWISALLDRELTLAEHREASERLVRDPRARLYMGELADVGRELRDGVAAEAGPAPSLWHGVADAIGIADPEHVEGWDETLLAAAVADEVGAAPSVAEAVLETIARDARAVVPAVKELPVPANDNRAWGGLALLAVAAAVLLLLAPQLAPFVTSEPTDEWVERPLTLAAAGEVNVDALSYGENTSVYVEVPTDSETPLIIWVDDGTNF